MASEPEMSTAPSIKLAGIGFDYHNRPLFDNLDLFLEGGQWTCLLGESGVGKTSLLRLIAGLTHPHARGDISCSDGVALTGRVAYMAQQDLLLPWLSAIDNVMLGSRLRGKPNGQRQRAQQLLAQVGLAGAEQSLPAVLSGGMRQRVALARTLLEDRPIVLMDEPFSGLDAITRYRLQELSAHLLAGRTTLLITHDPYEALRLGRRIYVLAGRPARLLAPMEPPGTPPRSLDDAELLALHGQLLKRLAGAPDAA